jgi:hypothetical protein
MTQFEGGRMENWLVMRAEEFLAQSQESGFAEAAENGNIKFLHFGPVNLNFGNVSLFNPLDEETIPELGLAVENENFWKAAFFTPLNTASAPFAMGENIVILIPVEENEREELEKSSLSDWYSRGWMEMAMDSEIRSTFSASKKFENKFGEVFFTRFFAAQL